MRRTLLVVVCFLMIVGVYVGIAFATKPTRQKAGMSTNVSSSPVRKFEAIKNLPVPSRPHGTSIAPHPDATGALLRTHKLISIAFANQQPVPDDRIRFYSNLQDRGVKLNGWYGVIRHTELIGNVLNVEIQVSPHLILPKGGIGTLTQHHIEMYRFENGFLVYAGGGPEFEAPAMMFID